MNKDAVSIEWPKADVDALWRQVERAQKELGKTLGQAVRFAAWSVARSLGTITTMSKKVRPYRVVNEGRGVSKFKGGKKYEVTSMKKGKTKTFNVRAKSVSELKKMTQVKIGKAGLAKSAWMWGIRQIGGGKNIGMAGATDTAKKRGRMTIDVEKRLTGDDPFVKIINRLNYAENALIGGQSAVSSTMGKAARSMERIIDENIKKKLGAA
jgi:hypothetical protein